MNSVKKYFHYRFPWSVFVLSVGVFSSTVSQAQAVRCDRLLLSTLPIINARGVIPAGIEPFNMHPDVIRYVTHLVQNSRIKPEPQLIPGFNTRVDNSSANSLDRYIRSQTPSTVRMMVAELLKNVEGLSAFRHLGIVVGDPHNGNFNTQAEVYGPRRDTNTYRVVDLDEVGVGIMTLDFSRYVMYLKANAKDLDLNQQFETELVQAYVNGLRRGTPMPVPEFITANLKRTPEQIRRKINFYAENRTNDEGKFKKSLFKKKNEELLEFTTKNMKPEFLNLVRFNRNRGDRDGFKNTLVEMMKNSLKTTLGDRFQILDIAIPFRETGGSAAMQRFLLSVELMVNNETQRVVIEFKQNTERSGWEAIIDSPQQSPADRYGLALRITTDDIGPLSGVANFHEASFLIRVKGGDDIEYSGKQKRELALFNAYFMGLFHGSQGAEISLPHITAVVSNQDLFKDVVLRVANRVTARILQESGNEFR
ncbi:MAG: DUF2252 family protein [Pseudobdellovibrionaceae bacterium]